MGCFLVVYKYLCPAKSPLKISIMVFDLDLIRKTYSEMPAKVDAARKALGRPLTLAEKILFGHLWSGVPVKDYARGKDYVDFAPDRVAMQDATAQMALLQFDTTGRKKWPYLLRCIATT